MRIVSARKFCETGKYRIFHVDDEEGEKFLMKFSKRPYLEVEKDRLKRTQELQKEVGDAVLQKIVDVDLKNSSYTCTWHEGVDLATMVRDRTVEPLDLRELFLKAYERVVDLNQNQGLLHADIKGSNILVSGATRDVMFIDAEALREIDISKDNEVLGTSRYFSPHVWRGYVGETNRDNFAIAMTAVYEGINWIPKFWRKSREGEELIAMCYRRTHNHDYDSKKESFLNRNEYLFYNWKKILNDLEDRSDQLNPSDYSLVYGLLNFGMRVSRQIDGFGSASRTHSFAPNVGEAREMLEVKPNLHWV